MRQFLFSTSLFFFCVPVSRNENSFINLKMVNAVDLPGSVHWSVAHFCFAFTHFFLTLCMLVFIVMIGPAVGEWGGLVERPALLGYDAQVGVCL